MAKVVWNSSTNYNFVTKVNLDVYLVKRKLVFKLMYMIWGFKNKF